MSSHREFFAKLYGSIEEENRLREKEQKARQEDREKEAAGLVAAAAVPDVTAAGGATTNPVATPARSFQPFVTTPPSPHLSYPAPQWGIPHHDGSPPPPVPSQAAAAAAAAATAAAFRFGEFPFPGGLAAFRKYNA